MMRKPLLIVALIASLVCPAWQQTIVVKHKASSVGALVQKANSDSTCTASASCSITVTSTGSGHFGVILAVSGTDGEPISSVTTGGTWTCPVAAQHWSNNVGEEVSGCYIVSLSSGITTITVNWNGTPALPNGFIFYEYSCTGSCAVSYDTAGWVDANTSGNPQTSVALSLNGSDDIIDQEIFTNLGKPTGVNSPYGNFVGPTTYYWGTADLENTASGTAPTWPVSNSSTISISAAIAMRLK